MNAVRPAGPRPDERTTPLDRFGLNRWLQLFLTIIAGAVVAVIAWAVFVRLLHIIILLVASFLVAYLLGPLVERMEHGGIKRPAGIGLIYLVLFGVIGVGGYLLVGPLTHQLQQLSAVLPKYFDPRSRQAAQLDQALRQHGINFSIASLPAQLGRDLSGAGSSVLGGTLGIVTGTIGVITDLLLILVIAFYFLLDGHAMHNRAVRLLPAAHRERWFFFEATINKVVGGYIRGQLIVAATVGAAAGVGCFFLGVQFPLVIGLLAFLFEFIPMLGPVLGMIPAVIIALFQQPFPLTLWVIVYFIILQQVESNFIVPRVSGHAVGLHPLAALMSLIIGLDLGGIGGALLSVPLAGVAWVMMMALYSDTTGQSSMLVQTQRRTAVKSIRNIIGRRRSQPGTAAAADIDTSAPVPVHNERIAAIKHEQEQLIEQFEADQVGQAVAEHNSLSEAPQEEQARHSPETRGPDDVQAPSVTH